MVRFMVRSESKRSKAAGVASNEPSPKMILR